MYQFTYDVLEYYKWSIFYYKHIHTYGVDTTRVENYEVQ